MLLKKYNYLHILFSQQYITVEFCKEGMICNQHKYAAR